MTCKRLRAELCEKLAVGTEVAVLGLPSVSHMRRNPEGSASSPKHGEVRRGTHSHGARRRRGGDSKAGVLSRQSLWHEPLCDTVPPMTRLLITSESLTSSPAYPTSKLCQEVVKGSH